MADRRGMTLRRTARYGFAALWLACSLLSAARATAQQEQVYQINLPAQSVPEALNALSKQTGVPVLFPYDLARDRNANPVSGRYTLLQALELLLRGTGLSGGLSDNGMLMISATKPDAASNGETTVTQTAEALAKKSSKGSVFATIAALLTSIVTAQSGSAQEATAQGAQETGSKAALEEVLVTARKREERLQDVPISISVLSAGDISQRGLVNSEDYLRGIPGVSQAADVYGGAVVIRGIETHPSFQNYYTGATVATYFGETPTTSTAGLLGGSNVDIKLVDIERVEVLRGPQGTAFGSSSLGGAVRTIPVAPRLDGFEGSLGAGYSTTSGYGGENYNLQAVANIPLIQDKLAIRAAAYVFDESGYYRNHAASDPNFQATIVVPFGAQAFAEDVSEVGAYYDHGGRIAALFQATDDLKFTLSYLTQTSEIDGIPVANTGTYDQAALQIAPLHVRRGQRGGFSDAEIDIANAVMEYDFGWADLLATYSHTESRTVNAVPYTAYSIGWPTSAIYDSDHEEDSTEVRIATKFDGPWNFVAGLYAEDLKDEVIPPSDLAMQYVWTGDPATNFFNPGQLSVGGLYEKRDLEQKAAFGEVSWEFVPGLTLTGGVRLHDYERTTHFEQAGIFGSGSDDVAADESGNTFRGNLSYKFNENSLVYGGWSQGFRLGKPQSGLPASLCDINGDGIVDGTTNVTIESTKRINSDEVDNYELGGKFSLLDRRVIMEAAIFRIDWEGIPITTNAPLPPDGCALGYTANAGTARSEGIEFQASFLVTDAFRIDAGGSFIEAEFTEDAPSVNAVAGTRLPGSPKENANLSLQYQFEIGDRAAYIRADSIYVGPFYTVLGLGEVPSNRAGDYLKLDLSARVMFEKFDIDLFVRNVTDEDAFTLRDPFFPSTEFYGYRLRPRTVGMKVSVRF